MLQKASVNGYFRNKYIYPSIRRDCDSVTGRHTAGTSEGKPENIFSINYELDQSPGRSCSKSLR